MSIGCCCCCCQSPLGHDTSCVNEASTPRGAHTKAAFDQSLRIHTHTYRSGGGVTRTPDLGRCSSPCEAAAERERPHNLQRRRRRASALPDVLLTCSPPVSLPSESTSLSEEAQRAPHADRQNNSRFITTGHHQRRLSCSFKAVKTT